MSNVTVGESTLATEQDIQGMKDYFECEYCHDCNGDWYDHDILLVMGNPFYLCKTAIFKNYKVRQQEKI